MTARVRALQALFFGAYGTTIPFLAIYYGKVLSDANGDPRETAVGTILSVSALVGLASPLVAGYLSDKFRINNRLISIFALFVTLGAIGLFLPGTEALATASFGLRFTMLFTGAIVNGLFVRPIIPLIDTETILVLRSRDGSIDRYGEVRAFGAIGWIVTATLTGLYVALTGRMVHMLLFYAIGFLVLAAVGRTGFKPSIRGVRIPWAHFRNDRTYQRFLFFVFILSLGMTSGYVYTAVYLAELELNIAIIGLAYAFSAIPEVPVLLGGRRILNRLGSEGMIITGTTVQLVKFGLLFLIAGTNSPVFFIFVMLLQGAGYSLQFAGFVDFMDRRAHEHLRATYQSLYHIVISLGGAIGNFSASLITRGLSARYVMAFAAAAMGGGVIYFMLFVRGRKR